MKHLRTVATGVATLALGAALAAWGGAAQAQDKSKQVYFLSWGGTIQTMLEKEGWADQFAKDTGYTVTLVPKATSGEIIATAVAQKEKPQVDVVMCDLIAFLQGTDQGVFAKIDPAKVPNMAKMADMAKLPSGDGVYTYADVLAIIYHEEIFKKKGWKPPTTWADMLRPELKGTVVIPPVSNTYGLYTLVEFARMNGGSETNIDPGFVTLKKVAPNVVDWTTTFAKIGLELRLSANLARPNLLRTHRHWLKVSISSHQKPSPLFDPSYVVQSYESSSCNRCDLMRTVGCGERESN